MPPSQPLFLPDVGPELVEVSGEALGLDLQLAAQPAFGCTEPSGSGMSASARSGCRLKTAGDGRPVGGVRTRRLRPLRQDARQDSHGQDECSHTLSVSHPGNSVGQAFRPARARGVQS